MLLGAYRYLDLTPKGRDEEGLAHTMAWVRHHDRYEDSYVVDSTQQYVQPAASASCCDSEEHQGERRTLPRILQGDRSAYDGSRRSACVEVRARILRDGWFQAPF